MESLDSGVELKKFAPLRVDGESVAEPSPNATADYDVIQKPGSKIRPTVSDEEAIGLAERLYGISTSDICELYGYDDKNFKIHTDPNIKNPIIPHAWPHGYVLKIINSLDTKKAKFADAMTQVMLFLRQQGIDCPRPVMNIFGKYQSIEKMGTTSHLIRLNEFLPGRTFAEVLKTKHLFYQVGEFVARFDAALKHFTHDAYDNCKSVWMLESMWMLPKYLYVVEDAKRQALVQQVVDAFTTTVMDCKQRYAHGVIHGDFNEHNIIVTKVSAESNEFRVSGIIDFGDTCHTLYVLELGTTIAYMLMQSSELDTAGYIIAGYQEHRLIPGIERKVLKTCVAARLCQSLVLGIYSHSIEPSNDYLLATQTNGWTVLEQLWAVPGDEIEQLWFDTADNYLKQSNK